MHGPAGASRAPRDPRAGGWAAPGFEAVRAGFEAGQRDDPGAAQLAVYQDGQQVVDLWAGADPIGGRPVSGDSLSVVLSVTKGVVATCAHLLVQRGLLDLDAPVAAYWPEFARNGKETIRVGDVLAHRSGLSAFPPEARVGLAELLDWDHCTGVLAAMAPLWRPGTAWHYHALTYGYLVGEVIRRITGHGVGAMLTTDLSAPLALDLWIGLPAAEEPRVLAQFTDEPRPTARQVDEALARFGIDRGDPLVGGTLATMASLAEATEAFNRPAAMAAEIPAANGVGNARSLARLFAALIGPVGGTRLLTADTLERATTPQTDHLPTPSPLDRMPAGSRSRHALGYELPAPHLPMLGTGSFGHAGAGGRLAFAQPRTGTAVAYTCTNLAWDPAAGPDPRWIPWTTALRHRLGLTST
ncbi:serine hydrolase domain-containing protein [Actinoallomurus iriomotensis]|uniref:Esterase n=1 Tax=Actinoallomurus iriomotensis TaxID=478107 RepID=A0A9W6SE53_9ACTN|nr:serine hydrolase domain-containing protein [Actinoallomurus iriomotensis]GLY91934.1 esterase [Actinoallomurus iriomotensis]